MNVITGIKPLLIRFERCTRPRSSMLSMGVAKESLRSKVIKLHYSPGGHGMARGGGGGNGPER